MINADTLPTMQPLDDRILIERIDVPQEREVQLPCGLWVPNVALETAQLANQHRGVVRAKGPGRLMKNGWRRPIDVELGDTVRYQSSDLDTGHWVLIREDDILVKEEQA